MTSGQYENNGGNHRMWGGLVDENIGKEGRATVTGHQEPGPHEEGISRCPCGEMASISGPAHL